VFAISAAVGIVVVGIVAIVLGLQEYRKPKHGNLPLACYTVVVALIPTIAYFALRVPPKEHPIEVAALVAVGALLLLATRVRDVAFPMLSGPRGFALAILVVAALFASFDWLLRTAQFDRYCAAAAIFGAIVGMSEIISRYRDEPWLAASSSHGLIYVAINGVISAVAFGALRRYSDKVFPGVKDDKLLMSVLAGFGAMVVMRSKLFSFKTAGGEEFAVGPDAVITIFLRSVDRAIDRSRSMRREALIFQTTQNLVFNDRVAEFFRGSLFAYQNLTKDEKAEISNVIDQVKQKAELDPQLKLMAISFGFLNISGENNYRALMSDLTTFLNAPGQGGIGGPATPGIGTTGGLHATGPAPPSAEGGAQI
jgi:hypothetical protein